MRFAAAVLVLAACAGPKPEPVLSWPSETFFTPDKTFAGFPTKWLAAGPKGPGGTLLVKPAYAGGQPAAYLITEIWQNHPDVWVQPVYGFPLLPPAQQQRTLFGVGTDSTFYSPFWRQRRVQVMEGNFTSIEQVVEVKDVKLERGPLIVCPIVPDGVKPSQATHPYLPNVNIEGWVDGKAFIKNGVPVDYLDLGPDRQTSQNDDDPLVPARIYFFQRMGKLLLDEAPAVLPADATRHAYVQRVDVVLQAPEQEFIPEDHPSIPLDNRFRGRVAKNRACFADAASFNTCQWLDSEQAILAGVPPERLLETGVTLTATQRLVVP